MIYRGRSTLRLTKPSLTTCVKNGICTYANPNQNRHVHLYEKCLIDLELC